MNMNAFERHVFALLQKTYPPPKYFIRWEGDSIEGEIWRPDFEVMNEEKEYTVLLAEAKGYRFVNKNSNKTCLDNHMKRAFASLSLAYFNGQKQNLFVFLPDHVAIPEKYEKIFEKIGASISHSGEIPYLKESWN